MLVPVLEDTRKFWFSWLLLKKPLYIRFTLAFNFLSCISFWLSWFPFLSLYYFLFWFYFHFLFAFILVFHHDSVGSSTFCNTVVVAWGAKCASKISHRSRHCSIALWEWLRVSIWSESIWALSGGRNGARWHWWRLIAPILAGGHFGPLGDVLRRLGRVVGVLGAILGASGRFGCIVGVQAAILALLGAWGALWALLAHYRLSC